MRRGIRRLLAVIVVTAAALLAGHAVTPAHPALTDARFTDAELASAAFKTTAVPTITFTGCPVTQGSNNMVVTWSYNGTPLPGEAPNFQLQLGLNVVGTNSVTTTGPVGGVYTTTFGITSLSLGTYAVHATSSVGAWSAPATNHVEGTAATLLLATVWVSCGTASGS